MTNITSIDLANVTGGATPSRPGLQNSQSWTQPQPSSSWQQGAASWGGKVGQAAGQAVGQWWK